MLPLSEKVRMRRKKQHIQGWVLSMVLGIHWGSWDISFAIKGGGTAVFTVAFSVIPTSIHSYHIHACLPVDLSPHARM